MERKLAHWVGNGLHEVAVAGTSYHRVAIQKLAKNAPGVPALVLCHAELVLEADNPHDPLAVTVRIDGAVVVISGGSSRLTCAGPWSWRA